MGNEPRRGARRSSDAWRSSEAECASSGRCSCRSACARAADDFGNEPAKTCRSPGHRVSAAVQVRASQNRISASRLYELSKVLGVPITFFFESIGETDEGAGADVRDDETTLDRLRDPNPPPPS